MPLLSSPTMYSDLTDLVAEYITQLMKDNPDVFETVLQVNNFLEADGTNQEYDCITLLEAGLSEELMAGDTEVKYWLAPINVLIQTREAPTDVSVKKKIMGWRKFLMDTFRQKLIKLGTQDYNMQADVRSRAIFDAKSEQYQMIRSHFLLMFWMIEPRSF